jgi:diguanylate cyclase (GGDEF)-like protein
LLIVAFVGVLNYRSGHEVSLLLFYLVPVIQTAWFVGTRAGIIMAFICAVVWFYTNFFLLSNSLPPLISFWDTFMRLGIFLIVAYIISIQSALKRALESEKELSRTDHLTGALNSRAFSEAAMSEINRASRYGHPFSIAYIDLDDFKTVNDRNGHTMGNLLLRSVVESIREHIRSTDICARLGGDEFAILFPETGDEPVSVIMSKIRMGLSEKMKEKGWPVTASIGLVTYLKPPESFDEMIRKVDEVMYQVKKSGKNSVKLEIVLNDFNQ